MVVSPVSYSEDGAPPNQQEFCSVYPMTFSESDLPAVADPNQVIQLPLGSTQGNFIWLSWDGQNSVNSIEVSLTAPGNLDLYTNPRDSSDTLMEEGDWVRGLPGVKNSKIIRNRLNDLIGKEIVIPTWSDEVSGGDNREYKVARFVKVVLQNYSLNGKGFVSFRYVGDHSCSNSVPVALDQSVNTDEDTDVTFQLMATDENQDPLSYLIVGQPEHGTITLNDNQVIYTPSVDFFGADQLTFIVNDGIANSNVATVSVIINSVNDLPSANAQNLETPEDTLLSITLTGQDQDGQTLTYTLVSQPQHGTLSGAAPSLIYTPDANFFGDDIFEFVVDDGVNNSIPVTVNIEIKPINDAPNSQELIYTIDEDSAVSIQLVGNDIDNDSLTYTLVSTPANGVLTGEAPNLVYTPVENFNGNDVFTYEVSDGELVSSVELVGITIVPVNDIPVITSDAVVTAKENHSYSYEVEAIDDDGDALTYALSDAPQGMFIDGNSGLIQWLPGFDAEGSKSVTVIVTDIYQAIASQTYTLTVVNTNRAPQITSIPVVYAKEGTTYTYAALASDADGDQITYRLINAPDEMTIDASSGVINWLPNYHQAGTHLVQLEVQDSNGENALQQFEIDVANVNRAPIITSVAITTGEENAPYTYDLNANDPDGDSLLYTLISGPSGMSIDPQSGVISWLPNYANAGTHTILAGVSDAHGASASNDYLLTIQNVNRVPLAHEQNLRVNEDESLSITFGGSDADGDLLIYTVMSQPTNGILTGTVPNMTYQPYVNFNGSDSFTFKVNDGIDDSNIATMSISVTPVNDAPVITSSPVTSAQENQTYSYTVTTQDTEGDSIIYSLQHAPDNMIIHPGTGVISWTPGLSADATTLVVVIADDQHTGVDSQTFEINVDFALNNQTPEIVSAPVVFVNESGLYHYDVDAIDPGKDELSYSLTISPGSALINNINGDLSWTAESQFVQSNALANNLCRRIVDDIALADLRIGRLFYDDTNEILSVLINNRGLASTESAVALNIFSGDPATGGVLLGTEWVQPLIVNDTVKIDFTAITPAQLTTDIWAVLDTPASVEECVTDNNQAVALLMQVKSEDPQGLFDQQMYLLNVDDVNDAPQITSEISDSVIQLDTAYTYQVLAIDPDVGDVLGYSLLEAPDDATIDPNTGLFAWTPSVSSTDSFTVSIKVKDLQGDTAIQTFSLSVYSPLNGQPVINSSPIVNVQETNTYEYSVLAADPDSDTLSYSLQIAPPGMVIDPDNGLISWQTDNSNIGPHQVAILVSDGNDGFAFQNYVLAVTSTANQAPVITTTPTPTLQAVDGIQYIYHLNASDPDADSLAYSLDSGPASMAIDSVSGQIDWIPENIDVGPHSIKVSVSDGRGGLDVQTFSLLVTEAVDEVVVSEPGYSVSTCYAAQEGLLDQPAGIVFDANGDLLISNSRSLLSFPSSPAKGNIIKVDSSGNQQVYSPNSSFFFGPHKIALSPGGEFGFEGDLFVGIEDNNEYGGNGQFSAYDLVVRVPKDGGTPVVFTRLANETNAVLFGKGNGFGDDLYTSGRSSYSGPLKLYRVNSSGDKTVFNVSNNDGNIYGIGNVAFGLGGDWGTDMYISTFEDAYSGGLNNQNSIYRVDPTGSATKLLSSRLSSIVFNPMAGTLFGDYLFGVRGSTIYKMDLSGNVSEFISGFQRAQDLTFAPDGSLCIADPVLKSIFRIAPVPIPNVAPVITSTPILGATPNAIYRYDVNALDLNIGDTTSYALTSKPFGMSIDDATGEITWVPETNEIGTHFVSVTATDGAGSLDTQVFSLEVMINTPPVITSNPFSSAPEGQAYSYYMSAIDPEDTPLTYSLEEAPAGVVIDEITGLLVWPEYALLVGNHTMRVRVTDTGGLFDEQEFTVNLNGPNNNAPVITSVPLFNVMPNTAYQYQLEASDDVGDIMDFILIQNPAGMIIDQTTGLINWLPQTEDIGVYTVIVQVSDHFGAYAQQSYSLSVVENKVPQFTSVPPIAANAGQLYQYDVNAIDPENGSLIYAVTLAPDGMTMNPSTGLIDWTPSVAQVGVNSIEVTVTDNFGYAMTQNFNVQVASNSNSTPVITSIPVSPALVDNEYVYRIVVFDADSDALTYSLDSAPIGMQIDPSGQLTWTPSIDQVGEHPVEIRVSDAFSSATQNYTLAAVDNAEGNQYPDISSLPPFNATINQLYTYQMVASDGDNDPLVYGALSSPDGLTISSTGLVQWIPTSEQVGYHEVVLFVDDGKGRTLQSFSVNVSAVAVPLTASLIVSPESATLGETVSINLYTDGGSGSLTKSLTVDNQPYQIDLFGHAELTVTEVGLHSAEATVFDNETTVITSASYFVIDPSDTTAPVVTIVAPTQEGVITGPIDVVATIQDTNLTNYQILISPIGQQQWQVISEGTGNVSESVVAVFDPTLLLNGQYSLAIKAEDSNGRSTVDSVTISVEGDLKVGNFSITLEDVNIPMVGLPIRVTRTYDSRRRFEALDFGYGWSVGYQDVKIEESRTPGNGWALNQYNTGPYGLDLNLCVEPLGAPIVTITLPTGDVERFEVAASPQCNSYTAIKDVELIFNPVGDTQSVLTALDDQFGYYANGQLVETGTYSTPIDPDRYLLVTQAGYKYYLNQGVGIEKVIDPNGHTLTYTNDGIFHSSGKSVTFNRDNKGRILSITDPSGNVLDYTYEQSGNLVSSEDALNNETSYTYNSNHGLLDIIDPLGRTLVKNIYDDDGRLIAQEDNDGNRTDFNHDIEGRQSVVTDRNGNTTFYYYDDRGNVTSKVDAENNTWSYSYDDHGNQLSQVDPLGYTSSAIFDERNNQLSQTDALGNTVYFSYNPRGQELTIEDARGNVYNNSYDSVGNLLTVTDPTGQIAGNNINAGGQVSKTVDVLGNETTYTYDEDGNKLTETNMLGETITFSYDDNGNMLSETRSRTTGGGSVTETTRYVYDARNRVLETQLPDGTTSEAEYDAAGNQVATIDMAAHRTEYEYDAYGRITNTYYHDGASESKTYDGEGNVLTDTNRKGQITRYTYDGLNRVTHTEFADGSTSSVTYDAASRVVSETDANANVTFYEYDAAGRRTAVINALGHRHTFEYDADGNLTSETDANGNATSYEYNALNQRIKTTFRDSSAVQEGFDGLGRRTLSTDQASVTTNYGYDALGRLIKVTDVTGNETTFSYDEAGNKLSQTDAEGRTTFWSYDSQGRVLSRSLPLGQTEQYTYDLQGNVENHTDFNGQSTTYSYDQSSRLIQSDYADSTQETFTYNVLGNRLTAISSEGTTSYEYDAGNRLVSETQLNGAVLTYGYDLAGNRTSVTVRNPNGEESTTTYSYDALNRLEAVTELESGLTSYGYDSVGNRTSISYANGTSTTYVYDDLNRLINIKHYGEGGALTQSFDYALHATGRRTQIDELSGRTTSYSYDDLYRLTDETVTDDINGNYSAEYQYDKVGNRTASTVDGVSTVYAYDDNDRITSQGGTSYTYDDNGNTLTESIDSDVTTYTYDAKNKLTGVDKLVSGVTTNSSYTYNADGIRTSQTVEGVETKYVVDSNRDYAQVLFELDSADAVQVQYTYGDDLISQDRAGSVSYYHYDGLGSTRALSNGAGDITDTYNYEAFGELLNSTGASDNSYLFAGEQTDSFLGQQYLRARYYDSGIGRFTQQDTYMGNNSDPVSLHKYLYASSDPANWTDPTGNFSLASVGAANNVASILVDMQVQSGLSLLDGAFGSTGNTGAQASVRDTQMLLGIAQLGAGGIQLLKMLSKKFRSACNSFTEDTLVSTENGLKRITDIKIGDKVWAYNEETGEKSLQEVVHLIHGEGDKEIVDITLMSGEVIQATSGHPFYVNNEDGEWSWLNAGDLVTGSTLTNLNGDELQIASVNKYLKQLSVFNLTVDKDHTYYVGEEAILNHNAGACKPLSSVDMDHILYGSNGGGWHHMPSGSNSTGNNIVKYIVPRGDSQKPYSALVKLKNGTMKKSSFWPDSWSSKEIGNAIKTSYIQHVIGKGLGKGNHTLKTKSQYGFDIKMHLKSDGKGGLKVDTAYPNI